MNQNEAVIITLEKLGGVATLGQLNQEVFKISDCEWKTKTPFASIRRIVQLNEKIYKIKPGLYGLVDFKKKLESKEFNHSYYQGLLLTVGNLKGLKTFVPNQDKNRYLLNTKLSEISTLNELPPFTYPQLVQRSSTIDVIWLNDREMPHSFFEVEHSTDIQNSLLKFNDLQDLFVRMVIVADSKRKSEYLHKIKYSSFKDLTTNPRVAFLDYDALNKQYEYLIEQQKFELIL